MIKALKETFARLALKERQLSAIIL